MKEHQIKALHECIETCSQLSAACAVARIACRASNRRKLKAYVLLGSYVADILESEDLLSMKRESQTVFPCQQRFD